MKQIEHNRNERRPTNRIWWVTLAILAFIWGGYLYFNEFDFWPIAVGFSSGMALAIWGNEKLDSPTK